MFFFIAYCSARYYDPGSQRFISRDTYNGTVDSPLSQNHYLYAGANPTLYVDPSGRCFTMSGMMQATVITGILATSYYATIGNNSSGVSVFQNAWISVAMYNVKTWLMEEYSSVVLMAGKMEDTPSPLEDWLENEYLDSDITDYSCDELEEILEMLKAQLAWRIANQNYNDPDDSSGKIAKTHKVRIERLKDIIANIESYLRKPERFGGCGR